MAVGGQTGTSSENFTVTAPAPAPAPPVVSSFSPIGGRSRHLCYHYRRELFCDTFRERPEVWRRDGSCTYFG